MEPQALRQRVLAGLCAIAPEVDPGALDDEQPLRRQVDLDSMDWLNFLIGLHRDLQIDIPESDYAKLATLHDLLDYLAARLPAGSA
ncbi:acyl carrier protein [Noviherbaspirillum pedocola]|uniref:Acyl carrier protein n=1 Tax=Noviherbaspirillum pedocola TaxID=2801341 RepID=A0A934W944_9BURK|nr:acyl carrier protein [Noviherbaspirillum pedocola]MBK4737593.1 acyl carrier protein [Noviherbaspirillum pedocola]